MSLSRWLDLGRPLHEVVHGLHADERRPAVELSYSDCPSCLPCCEIAHPQVEDLPLATKVLDLSGGGEGTAGQPLVFHGPYQDWVERTGHDAPGAPQ